MAQYNKRREATRRQLEEQLKARQQRDARRRQSTLIASVVGALLVVGLIIGLVVGLGGNNRKHPDAAGNSSANSGASSSATASATPSASTTVYPTCHQASAKDVHFDGVSVGCATQLGTSPAVTSTSKVSATALKYKDLVVGKGPKATDTSTVEVQYTGVLYKNGTEFDSSWKRGQPATFSLEQVVKGFTDGIGGVGTTIPPMRVGGRRIMILPSSLGYGTEASGAIPANSSLVFVVDLLSVQS